MSVDLKAGIVRVLKPNGETSGTGFVVTDEGLIATCAHVVQGAGAGPGDTVRVAFHVTGEEREDTPAENPLLIAICFASLRSMLITWPRRPEQTLRAVQKLWR